MYTARAAMAAGADHPELGPGPQKRPQPAVGLAQKHIGAAGLRKHRRQLGHRTAPHRLTSPQTTHSARISPTKPPVFWAITCGLKKMPEPITSPTTMATTANRPSTWSSWCAVAGRRRRLGCWRHRGPCRPAYPWASAGDIGRLQCASLECASGRFAARAILEARILRTTALADHDGKSRRSLSATRSDCPNRRPRRTRRRFTCRACTSVAIPSRPTPLLAGREAATSTPATGIPTPTCWPKSAASLHGAERAAITGSGMAALALVVLSQLESGDHVVVSNQLYGRTLTLLTSRRRGWASPARVVDACDLSAV